MRLAPVRPGGDRWASVNQDIGIAPVEYLGDGDRDSLVPAYHSYRRLDLRGSAGMHDDERLSAAFSAWEESLAVSGMTLRLERQALYGVPLARTNRWSVDARGISLRPWDIELTAIEARLRGIVKWDLVPKEFADVLREGAERRGLLVELVVPQDAQREGSVTLVASHDAAILAEARELEQSLLTPGAQASAPRMGELLGYPPCCVRRFARVAEHNDTTLAWALLPGAGAPASPLTQWLQPGLALVSHSPCEVDCAASIALGQRLLDAVDAVESGFAAHWRSFAARVQVVDQRGNRLALAVDGSLDTPRKVMASDLLSSGGPDAHAVENAASLVGKWITIDSGGLVATNFGWYAPYVADHRGES